MKSVQCPICRNTIFSETFVAGESFPCPHCDFRLDVDSYDQTPQVHTHENLFQDLNWAHGIWKNGRLFLTPQKLAVLGEMFVNAMEMEAWSGETLEQLRERLAVIVQIQGLAKESGQLPILQVQHLLLDLFIRLKVQEEEGRK